LSNTVIFQELKIRNFLSLENSRINLEKFIVLVGRNASGKSNIAKAFALLSKLNSNTISSIMDQTLKMPIKQIFYDPNRGLELRLRLKIKDNFLSYKISTDPGGLINEEEITFEDGNIILSRKANEVKYRTVSGEVVPFTYAVNYDQSLLYSINRKKLKQPHSLIRKVNEVIGNIQTYSFNADRIRSISPSGFKLTLERDGSNLAQVLHTLITYDRQKFLKIEETMKDLIPDIEEINVPTTENGTHVYLILKEKKIPQLVKYQNISDGTLRILSFITALNIGGSIVIFEEPENCIHPHLLETLVSLCENAPCQVVITTHSPYLVDKISPETLRLVVKKDGKTKVRGIRDKEKVKKFLDKGIPLGEIWGSGELDEPDSSSR